MTREEAIKFLKSGCLTLACEYHVKNRCNADYREKEVKKDEALKMAIESLESKWIPCSERLPSENGKYLATGIKGSVYIAEFSKGVINGKPVSLWCRSGGHYCNVIAWMELPPAYEGE